MVTTRAYGVHVEDGATASANCVVFIYRISDQHRAGEFRLAATSFDDSALSIPSSRQATFQEQLRVLREAHGVFAGTEAGDEDFIKERMREAFGDRVRIEVTLIKPATRLGP